MLTCSKVEASVTLQSQLNQLEKAIDERDDRLGHLEERLRLAKHEIEAKKVHIQELGHVEEKLRLTTNDLDAKEAQIQRLAAANKSNLSIMLPQSSNVKGQEHPKRKANRAEKRLPSVVEDSQPTDEQNSTVAKGVSVRSNKTSTPSRYQHGQSLGTNLMSSPLEDLDDMLDDLGDLAGLFPSTPVPAAQTSSSSTKSITQDTAGEEVSPTKRLAASRDSHSTTHMSIHFSQSANSNHNFAGTGTMSQAQPADRSRQGSKHDKHDAHRQQTISRQSSRRHSVLKESTAEKRSASVAGLSPPNARGRSKRIKDLGPVIPDSQSPHGSRILARNHRPAKMNSKKQPKGISFR